MTREFTFRIVTLIFVIATVELASWIFATLSARFGVLHFYPSDIFSRVTDEQLARDSQLSPLGWPSDDKPRPAPLQPGTICGSAFGDSFTFGGEVEESEAWVHLLSRRLDCSVVNYGVSGYGLDQAVLRYERIAAAGNFVMLGLFTEMLRRNVAASWTFYSSSEPPVYSSIKPYFTLAGNDLLLHSIPKPLTRELIAAHHAHDYYMQHVWTGLKFPYALQVAHAGYMRVLRPDEYRLLSDAFWGIAHPSGSGVLARRLIDRFMRMARDRNDRVAVVLMPHVDRLLVEDPLYDSFTEELRGRGDVCVIDTKQSLVEQVRLLGPSGCRHPIDITTRAETG